MSILKTIGKVAGTAALSATWLASGILKHASDVAGFDLGSELFSVGNEASAAGIKMMWGIEDPELDNIDETDEEIAALTKVRNDKRLAASRCHDMALAAKKAGNEDRYEQFMQRYLDLIDEVNDYDLEISKIKQDEP